MRSTRGFTLIEVLAAVAILAIAMAALISGMARYAGNASHLREKTLALIVAHNRLAQFELEPAWPSEGRSDGDTELGGIRWRWEAEVKKTPDDSLRRVDISVHREDDKEKSTVANLSGFVADLGNSGGTAVSSP